jgi:hypothetical protein
MHKALLVVGALLLGGCATGSFKELEGRPDPAIAAAQPLTEPIGLVADTQFHESRGVASRYFGLGGDELVDVTIRTGQQVIGAGAVLTAALERTASLPLVIHAGDAIDVSCQTEWSRFKQVMTSGPRGAPGATSWLFAPGNHDGFLTGNIFPTASGLYWDGYWTNLCNAGQLMASTQATRYSFMAKHNLVRDYVGLLGGRFGTDSKAWGCDAAGKLCWTAYAPSAEPWTSYLVQVVKLPQAAGSSVPVYAVLLDSSDYLVRPYLNSLAAGLEGSLSYAQLNAARKLVSAVPATARYFFIAHHPAEDWKARKWSPERLGEWHALLRDPRSLNFLVSAHTHTGSLRRNESALGTFLELNTGSLADAPVYLRTLQFHGTREGRVGVLSEAVPIAVDAQRCTQLLPKAPSAGLDYGVDTQRSESDRAGERRPGPVALATALRYFFALWESKHKELRPQLLAYADIVEAIMPAQATLTYVWTATDAGRLSQTLNGPQGTAAELRQHANCIDGVRKCSVQAKGNLLLAVEDYFVNPATPADVRARAQEMMLCMAVTAANDSAAGKREVGRVHREIAQPWSFWLTADKPN